jgi:hypothetical protein
MDTVQIDDQPIAATFFGEGRWLTDFITPDALEVQELHEKLTKNLNNTIDKITACWNFVTALDKWQNFIAE